MGQFPKNGCVLIYGGAMLNLILLPFKTVFTGCALLLAMLAILGFSLFQIMLAFMALAVSQVCGFFTSVRLEDLD